MDKSVSDFLDAAKLKERLASFKTSEERKAYVLGLNEGLDIGTTIFRAGLDEILAALPSKIEAVVIQAMSEKKKQEGSSDIARLPDNFDVELSQQLSGLFKKLRNPKSTGN